MSAALVEVDTPQGPARLHISASEEPKAVLVLGHGAGGGMTSIDLVALAAALPDRGITVVLHEQPWKVAGRRIAVRPPLLDQGWTPTLDAVRDLAPGAPLLVGGHSAGARVACRTARETGAVGVLALSFPLHPPGRPDRSRAEELLGAGVPVLVVQGERDPFGGTGELAAAIAGREGHDLLPVPMAGHDLKLPKASGTTTAAWWGEHVDVIADVLLGFGG